MQETVCRARKGTLSGATISAISIACRRLFAAVPVATPRRSRLRLRSALFPLFGVVCVALAVFFLFPMGGETLRLQAERALSDMLGRPVAVSIGATRLALGADSLIARAPR